MVFTLPTFYLSSENTQGGWNHINWEHRAVAKIAKVLLVWRGEDGGEKRELNGWNKSLAVHQTMPGAHSRSRGKWFWHPLLSPQQTVILSNKPPHKFNPILPNRFCLAFSYNRCIPQRMCCRAAFCRQRGSCKPAAIYNDNRKSRLKPRFTTGRHGRREWLVGGRDFQALALPSWLLPAAIHIILSLYNCFWWGKEYEWQFTLPALTKCHGWSRAGAEEWGVGVA